MSQNQKKDWRDHEDYKEHFRPYLYVSDDGLKFYLLAYTRRWLHEKERGYKNTLKWHIRAIITEIKLRGGYIDRRKDSG